MQSQESTFKSVFQSFVLLLKRHLRGFSVYSLPFERIFFGQKSANYCMVTNCIILTRGNAEKGSVCYLHDSVNDMVCKREERPLPLLSVNFTAFHRTLQRQIFMTNDKMKL